MAYKPMYGWRKQFPDPRDYPYRARLGYKVAPEELPAEIDLSNLILRVKDQNPLGSCVAHGVTSAFEALQVSRIGTDFPGCRKQVYQNARVIGGYYPGDNGCNIRDGIKATVQNGVAHESLWQYQPTGDFDSPIKSNVIADALKSESTNYYLLDGANSTEKVNNIWNCLASTKLPVVFGMPVFQQYEDPGSSGIIEMPGANEGEIGGHCNLIFGRTADNYYKSLNSWTESYGAKFGKFKGGMCLLPEAYVKKYVSDCWVVANESEISPLPAKVTSASPPRTVTSGSNVDTFVIGSDGALWWKRNTAAWLSLSGNTQQIVPPTSKYYPAPEASYINGVLTVDVEGTDGGIWRRTLSGTTWTGWKEVFLNLN